MLLFVNRVLCSNRKSLHVVFLIRTAARAHPRPRAHSQLLHSLSRSNGNVFAIKEDQSQLFFSAIWFYWATLCCFVRLFAPASSGCAVIDCQMWFQWLEFTNEIDYFLQLITVIVVPRENWFSLSRLRFARRVRFFRPRPRFRAVSSARCAVCRSAPGGGRELCGALGPFIRIKFAH